MHPRKLLPLGAAVLLAVAALLAWRASAPSVPRGGEAALAPATLPGEPAAPVPPPARARPSPPAPTAAPAPSPAPEARGASAPGPAPAAAQGPAPGSAVPRASAPAAAPPAAEQPPMSKDDIRAAVREVLPGLRRCYEPVAGRDASEHKVVVRFTLVGQGSSGFFKDADILESTLNDPLFLSCLLQELSQARFRAPWGTGEVTITYPFTLSGTPRDAG